MKADFISSIQTDDDYDDLIIAIDSTGIKITNRGQWMDNKWRSVRNKKEGLSKNPYCCKYQDQRNPCFFGSDTDENVHDAKIMRKLVRHIFWMMMSRRRKGSN